MGMSPSSDEASATTPANVPLEPPPPPAYVFVRHAEILGDPHNLRESLKRIPELAASIEKHSLLENLVGHVIPEAERLHPDQWIMLDAGSRRHAAIAWLIERGRWHPDRLIAVNMSDGVNYWGKLAENIDRVDAQPWEIGRYLANAADKGETNRQIGTQLGRTCGWVSRYMAIGRGLHPDTTKYIVDNKLDQDSDSKKSIRLGELHRISQLRNRYGEPDAEKQIAAINNHKGRRSYKRRRPEDMAALRSRIMYLEREMPVPPLIRPVVSAVIQYLEGGGKPNFHAIVETILGMKSELTTEPD